MTQNWAENWQNTQVKMDIYANCKEDVFKLRDLMLKIMNIYLESPENDNYQLLQKVFIGNCNHMIFETMGEMRRMLHIVEILEMERMNYMVLFSKGVSNADALMEKYVMTIFAIRRVELEPTEDMLQEGIQFLLSNHISPVAIVHIVNEELFIDPKKIFRKMELIYEKHEMHVEQGWMRDLLEEMQKGDSRNE